MTMKWVACDRKLSADICSFLQLYRDYAEFRLNCFCPTHRFTVLVDSLVSYFGYLLNELEHLAAKELDISLRSWHINS